MKIAVTGAAGFVGRALVVKLAAQGHRVCAIVRRAPDCESAAVEYVSVGDLGQLTDWRRLVASCDAIVHLAALAHQIGRRGKGRIDEFMLVNAEFSRRAAIAARAERVPHFVLLSSVAVVGSRCGEVITEATAANPDTDYGRSKLAAERAVGEVLSGSDTRLSILRAPLVYGPGNPGNMERLLRLIGRKLVLPFAAIDNRRSFLFVDNLVDAIAVTLEHPDDSVGTYFVDDGTRMSTPELCRALGRAAGHEVRMARVPYSVLRALGYAGDVVEFVTRRSSQINSYSIHRLVESLVVDGSAFRRAAKWQPPVKPEDGIRQTVERMDSQRAKRVGDPAKAI